MILLSEINHKLKDLLLYGFPSLLNINNQRKQPEALHPKSFLEAVNTAVIAKGERQRGSDER